MGILQAFLAGLMRAATTKAIARVAPRNHQVLATGVIQDIPFAGGRWQAHVVFERQDGPVDLSKPHHQFLTADQVGDE